MTVHKHAFSVDVEDWYQGIELPLEGWLGKENRVEIGLGKILNLLHERDIKATFFTLGSVARSNPTIIKTIVRDGHEIASHTMFHEKIYNLNPEKFLEQEKECKKILEDVSEAKVMGFRAPYFSITRDSLWALDVLAELGYTYDSSISPVKTWRYGIPGIAPGIYQFKSGLVEFTPSLGNFSALSYGVGGAYLRIYPYWLTKMALKKASDSNSPGMFYVHPWELDPGQPKLRIEARAFFTHYWRLGSTLPKLKKLTKDYSFATIHEIIEKELSMGKMKSLDLSGNAKT
jgi:polysaccharide deacetylase family protein (PEP-CTERM system associated)